MGEKKKTFFFKRKPAKIGGATKLKRCLSAMDLLGFQHRCCHWLWPCVAVALRKCACNVWGCQLHLHLHLDLWSNSLGHYPNFVSRPPLSQMPRCLKVRRVPSCQHNFPSRGGTPLKFVLSSSCRALSMHDQNGGLRFGWLQPWLLVEPPGRIHCVLLFGFW